MRRTSGFQSEHARVLCGAPYYSHHDLSRRDMQILTDLESVDLVYMVDGGHDCNCEYCDVESDEWALTEAGEAAKAMLSATPAGVEVKNGRVALRVLEGGQAA